MAQSWESTLVRNQRDLGSIYGLIPSSWIASSYSPWASSFVTWRPGINYKGITKSSFLMYFLNHTLRYILPTVLKKVMSFNLASYVTPWSYRYASSPSRHCELYCICYDQAYGEIFFSTELSLLPLIIPFIITKCTIPDPRNNIFFLYITWELRGGCVVGVSVHT